MLQKLQEQLMLAKSNVRSKRKFELMLQQAIRSVQEEQSKSSLLKATLAKEESDVGALEGLSMTALFQTVLGNRDERLKKERQEFLAAKLKYDQAMASQADAQLEVQRLRDKLLTLAEADADFQRLTDEKGTLLSNANDERAEKLLSFTEKLTDLNAHSKELQEAVQAGQAALDSLNQVRAELGSAANWGTWDMLGGGTISTMIKHSKIDSAKQQAQYAQRQLNRFRKELVDAGQLLHSSIEVDGFSTFADYFFDGLIADWVVQSRIQSATSACSSTIAKVSSAVNECRRKLGETDREIESVNRTRQEFIEGA